MTRSFRFTFVILLVLLAEFADAQVPRPSPSDSMRIIEIMSGLSMRQLTLDSVTIVQTIAGGAQLREGNTKFGADSASVNRRTNIIEAFGHVHINDADTLHTTSRYLKYLGNERMAYLKGDVKMANRTSNLTTQDLEYDLKAGIGKYKGGGRVVNGETVLTSQEGTYIADTKEIYFRKDVLLVGPKYKIRGDSLIYNSQTEMVTFTGPTYIHSKDGDIFTTSGTYDLKSGNALFTSRTSMKDSSGRTISGNSIAVDEKSNTMQIEGGGVIKDSAGGYTIMGGQIFFNTKDKSFLSTRKPVMIIKQDKDSTFIAADTLYSAFTKRIPKDTTTKNADDSSFTTTPDSTSLVEQVDTINKPTVIDVGRKDSLVRYFKAFRHTRIFSDSMQAICDSLYYSELDSAFRLYFEPVVWNKQTQITGDTIYLFMKEKKVDHVSVMENGMVINKSKKDLYNQVGGKTINGFFNKGSIEYLRIKGSPAESIYYIQDDDSAFVGMNRATGAVIDMFFVKEDLKKVKFVQDTKGTLYPIKQIPEEQKFLNGFNWFDSKRPKNRLELFE